MLCPGNFDAGGTARARGTMLRAAYAKWCKANDETPVGTRVFGQELTRRGFARLKSGGANWWKGIELNERGFQYLAGIDDLMDGQESA